MAAISFADKGLRRGRRDDWRKLIDRRPFLDGKARAATSGDSGGEHLQQQNGPPWLAYAGGRHPLELC
jgi:hypothetical protein